MNKEYIIKSLTGCRLKVTPQRIAVMDAVIKLKNHPTAENIAEFIKVNHPNIATGTVYKTLELLVKNNIIKKVKTDSDVMRYDAITEKHHHLYSAGSVRIEDYYDNELIEIIDTYFSTKSIPNFEIEDIKLQIIGRFSDIAKDKNKIKNKK